MKHVRSTIKQHPIISAVFVIAVCASFWFCIDLVTSDRSKGAMTAPAPWMTPRFIAASWDVDASDLSAALGIAQTPPYRPTIENIARARGVPVETVLTEVIGFIAFNGPDND